MSMKFKAHQSFFIRKGWLSKGIHAVKKDKFIFMPSNSKDAMDGLGLGSNQVVALKYWMLATGLMTISVDNDTKKKCHTLTSFGICVDENDPFIEEMGTLWALHCNLASNEEEATSWYFLFNEYGVQSFTKANFIAAIQDYIWKNGDKKEIAVSSLDADFSCILSTYIPREKLGGKYVSPENVIDCPLGDLGILDFDRYVSDGRGKIEAYRKRQSGMSSLPSLLVLYAILNKIDLELAQQTANEEECLSESMEISLEELLKGSCSPGRLYNLDSVSLLAKLYELENGGYLHIVRTAGLDVVRIKDYDMTTVECLEKYYAMIG